MEKSANFVGNAKTIGRKIQVSLNYEEIKKVAKNVEAFNGTKYIILDVIPLNEKGKWGHTHAVVEHVRQTKEATAEAEA